MFGVVPKVVWERVAPADEFNRVELSMRILLVKDDRAGRAILVDTGGGDKWSPTEIERFAFETREDKLGAGIAAAGLREEDITDILITHLHFDHNGGLTRWADQEREVALPRFPDAKVWLHRRHWQHTKAPIEKDRASFLKRDFGPVFEAGLLSIIEGDPPECPFEGMKLHLAHGHTTAMTLPWFADEERELLYASDLFPTFCHLPPAWLMAYDNEPLKTLREKKEILEACYKRDLMLASGHDPHTACARVVYDGQRPVIKETISL